jgi:hypothetical protein
MMNHFKHAKYAFTFVMVFFSLVCGMSAQGSGSREKAIIKGSLAAMAKGRDISLINAWHARAQTLRGGEGASTNFNSSCAALVYGYRESETSVMQSNVTFGPEFPPHIASIVLSAEVSDPNSEISLERTVAENGRVYDVISIRPAFRGNRDAAYAPQQVWYFDQLTNLPALIKFIRKDKEDILFLDDFRFAGDGWLAPYSAKYIASNKEQAAYRYSEIALKHEQCPQR